MMACGPISYFAVGLAGLLAFVLVAAVCAVALAHIDRIRRSGRDPFLDLDALADERFRKSQQ